MSTPPAGPDLDDPSQLRACLRDLVGLLGLPALWSSSDPVRTLHLLVETLVELLSLQACAVVARVAAEQPLYTVLYAGGELVDPGASTGWDGFLAARARQQDLRRIREDTPLGPLEVTRFPLGFHGGEGEIIVGAGRAGFPSATELVLLRSAASLAASGLRTARLALERERALRAKDEFLAMLGHELRNPLAPIVTTLELIKTRDGRSLPPDLLVIERQVGHLRRLVDDLLDVTRITTGKTELQPELIDLREVVSDAVEAAQPLISQRNHRLECRLPGDALMTHGDPLRLTQVLGNLLINAAKYTEPGGHIVLSARLDQADVVLQVTDNGVGIEPWLLPRVFNLFEQGRVSADRSRGGLGIGLCIVRSLVTMHGGSVTADSEGPGCGSTFTVRLPQASGGAVAGQPAPDVQPAAAGESILLVDDNRDAANVLGELLTAYGYQVRTCYHPNDALAVCDNWQPHVVIIDIGLPVMDGYELARRIRGRFALTPPLIIAVTGYGQPQDRERSFSAGIDLHLAKPVRAETLIRHISQALPAMRQPAPRLT